ncbi:MAG: hypothetical protein AMJ88_18320 [Anaerolineae bacterium SM23_ 63]|nr:MAG: hypothetical protein AMJ88_18320 [Anaerolineae bacterium SM23_ 63]
MSELDSRSAADFSVARGRAFFNKVIATLSGHPYQLMVYDEVREKLRIGGPVYLGVQPVPVDKIIGSVNRYKDFDRLFLPTQSHTQDRWRRINRAWYQDISLPPVQLYKVGDVYFVVDGNHRVSVARSKGQFFIDAEVRECIARVPLTEEVKPEDLERLGERVEFLERSRLDHIRPDAEIETTLLGGYDRLIEHIAVHRYFMGLEQGVAIPEPEAVAHWYDTLYLPIYQVIEKSKILDELPGRTAADLYLWVMDHLHFLRDQPGQESIDVTQAAKDFVEAVKESDDEHLVGGEA